MIFNICHMSLIFADVAEALRHGLSELGHTAIVSNAKVVPDCRNLILGAHLVDNLALMPEDSIILNLEQLESASSALTPSYLKCLHSYRVWDYSERNIGWLNNRGIAASHIRLGYAPALTRVPVADTQDIDVLFYGALNDRRLHVLRALQERGLNVVALSGALGGQLDAYIGRSKVVLNLHYYETKIFEIVRVCYLLNNKKAVVAEVGPDTEIESDIRAAVAAVPYEELVDTCLSLVADETRRRELEKSGFAIFSTRSQAAFLERAMADLIRDTSAPLPNHSTAIASPDQKNHKMPSPNIAIGELILRRSTPVIINSFNQLTYVRNIVTKLLDEGFRNIYILDQASTYPPLRAWLAEINERGDALALFSQTNKGPHDFFLSKTYDLFGGAPFVYSDPDLSWEQLAPDFLTRMFELAHRYKVFKVGPALTIPTENEIKANLKTVLQGSVGMGVAEFEARYWETEIEPGVFNAPIDTTMHLFVPQYYIHGKPIITGLRIGGPGYEVLHLPWFKNDPMPSDEYQFYLNLTTHTTWRST